MFSTKSTGILLVSATYKWKISVVAVMIGILEYSYYWQSRGFFYLADEVPTIRLSICFNQKNSLSENGCRLWLKFFQSRIPPFHAIRHGIVKMHKDLDMPPERWNVLVGSWVLVSPLVYLQIDTPLGFSSYIGVPCKLQVNKSIANLPPGQKSPPAGKKRPASS